MQAGHVHLDGVGRRLRLTASPALKRDADSKEMMMLSGNNSLPAAQY